MSVFGNIITNIVNKGKNVATNLTNPANRAAYIKKHFGTSSILSRLGVAGGYTAGYGVFSALTSSFERQQRAYYGEERYTQYYGAGADTVRAGGMALAGYLGFSALLGKDPILRSVNQAKYKSLEISGALAKSKYKKELAAIYKRNQFARFDTEYFISKEGTPLRFFPTPILQGPAKPAVLLKNKMRRTEALYSKKMSEITNRWSVAPTLRAGLTIGALTYGASPAYNLADRFIGDSGILPMIGIAGAAGAGYMVHKAKGYVPVAIAAAAGTATYASISRIRKSQTAEGTITDLSYGGAQSTTSKMNFSTAGLVQALHNANRKY